MERYREVGYRHFQIKVGSDAPTDIARIRSAIATRNPGLNAFSDPNQGCTIYAAIKVVHAVQVIDVTTEQPCRIYEECLHVWLHTQLPMKMHECVAGTSATDQIQSEAAEPCRIAFRIIGRAKDLIADRNSA